MMTATKVIITDEYGRSSMKDTIND